MTPPSQVPENVIAALKEAAVGARHWFSIGEALRDPSFADNDGPATALVSAFEYDLLEPAEAERRERWGPFAPMAEFRQGTFPRPLPQVEDQWLHIWDAVATRVEDAAVRARLCDLLWIRAFGDTPHVYAQRAIDALVDLSRSWWEDLYRAQALVRACELSAKINDLDRIESVTSRILEETDVSMRPGTHSKPGVTFRLVEALLRLPPKRQPKELDALLDRMGEVYGDDPFHLQTFTELKARRVKAPDQVKKLWKRAIDRWRESAKSTAGLGKLWHLRNALELARDRGFPDDAEKIRKDIEGIRPEEGDLHTASATVTIPCAKVDDFINQFIDRASWKNCLDAFGSAGPPSGDHNQNLKVVQDMGEKFMFRRLASQVVLGPENVPIRTPMSDAELNEVELARHEALGIQFYASIYADILDRVRDKFGVPPEDELSLFFAAGPIAKDVAERVGRGFVLFWEGKYDESAHVLVPRIEAIVRGLATEAGLPVIREPIGPRSGGVRSLGELLLDLKGNLDESW